MDKALKSQDLNNGINRLELNGLANEVTYGLKKKIGRYQSLVDLSRLIGG